MMMELKKKACTLENVWRFCKTRRENNSWSSNGLWFTRHEDNGFDMISKVPSFKLAPEGHTNSYSTLPLDVIFRETPIDTIRALYGRTRVRTEERGGLSRKAQLINCWLVSWEVDGGSTRWWTAGQTHSASSKISPPSPRLYYPIK